MIYFPGSRSFYSLSDITWTVIQGTHERVSALFGFLSGDTIIKARVIKVRQDRWSWGAGTPAARHHVAARNMFITKSIINPMTYRACALYTGPSGVVNKFPAFPIPMLPSRTYNKKGREREGQKKRWEHRLYMLLIHLLCPPAASFPSRQGFFWSENSTRPEK